MDDGQPLRVGPPVLEARVEWAAGARVAAAVRAEVERLIADLAPVLSEFEADADHVARRAACGLDWLLPCLELTIPVYEQGAVFRLRVRRDDATEMQLTTRGGSRVATVRLVEPRHAGAATP